MSKTPEDLANEILLKKFKFNPNTWTDFHTAFIYGYDAAKPEWVSVEERLPEKGEIVLWLTGKQGQWDCGRSEGSCHAPWCKDGCGESFERNVCYIGEWYELKGKPRITSDHLAGECWLDCFSHWMPLPTPPEE